jgi:nucleotide-binding universal stress UspA family protein
MYKRALVPLDGSPAAEAILPFLIQIAGPLGMAVVLVRVFEPEPLAVVETSSRAALEHMLARQREVEEARRRDAEEYLAPIAIELASRGVDVRAEVRAGPPVEQILAVAREAGADLIAMTTHGRAGLDRLLFGSVAEAVLRRADVPVFVIRQAAAGARAAAPDPADLAGSSRRR